jgi:hypothetical protein
MKILEKLQLEKEYIPKTEKKLNDVLVGFEFTKSIISDNIQFYNDYFNTDNKDNINLFILQRELNNKISLLNNQLSQSLFSLQKIINEKIIERSRRDGTIKKTKPELITAPIESLTKELKSALNPDDLQSLSATLTTINEKLQENESLTFTEKMRSSLEKAQQDINNVVLAIQTKVAKGSKKLGALPKKLLNVLKSANIVIEKTTSPATIENPIQVRKKMASVLSNTFTYISSRLGKIFSSSNMPTNDEIKENINQVIQLVAAPAQPQFMGGIKKQFTRRNNHHRRVKGNKYTIGKRNQFHKENHTRKMKKEKRYKRHTIRKY